MLSKLCQIHNTQYYNTHQEPITSRIIINFNSPTNKCCRFEYLQINRLKLKSLWKCVHSQNVLYLLIVHQTATLSIVFLCRRSGRVVFSRSLSLDASTTLHSRALFPSFFFFFSILVKLLLLLLAIIILLVLIGPVRLKLLLLAVLLPIKKLQNIE